MVIFRYFAANRQFGTLLHLIPWGQITLKTVELSSPILKCIQILVRASTIFMMSRVDIDVDGGQ